MGRLIKARELRRRPRRLGAIANRDGEERHVEALVEAISRRDEEVVTLAASIARRVLEDLGPRVPDAVEAMCRRALETTGGSRPAVLRVNEIDRRAAGVDAAATAAGVEVVSDPAVARFSCVVEAQGARVEHGLEPLVEQLRAYVRRRGLS